MTNKNRMILNQIKSVVRKTTPEGSLVILFGSRARGEAKKGSDWDILIVLPKDRLLQSDYDDVSYPLVKLGWDLNEPAIIKCYLCPPATMRAFYC